MIMLINGLPKDEEGQITFNPAGKFKNEYISGTVNPQWMINNFKKLAESPLPLSDKSYKDLESIGEYWKVNAERWRREGII